jgi:hypothetical protein
LWKEVLAESALTEEAKAEYRFAAARAAVTAGTGKGAETAKLSETQQAEWRRQAREWLLADLEKWADQLTGGHEEEGRARVLQTLRDWQRDAIFSAVRDDKFLNALPRIEQTAWREVWSKVTVMLEQTTLTKKP